LSPTHRRSGSKAEADNSNNMASVDQQKLLTEQTDKVKRLEQSMAAMRAENKALLDRIQELEYEKEKNSWHSIHGPQIM